MQFTYDKRLQVLISEIEAFLISNLPEAVKKLRVSEPTYSVFLWYFDSSVCDDFTPEFGVGVESIRTACSQEYQERSAINDCAWRPQQVFSKLAPRGKFKDEKFRTACNEAYATMLAANKSDLPLEDEGELLRPFRSMMHRVACKFNTYEWESILQRKEEFVVVSLDAIGYWLHEDLECSIPETSYKLLRLRGLVDS